MLFLQATYVHKLGEQFLLIKITSIKKNNIYKATFENRNSNLSNHHPRLESKLFLQTTSKRL